MAHPIDSCVVLGDSGHRGITSIATSRRDNTGRTIDAHQYRVHRKITARIAHVSARLRDWQRLRQCRPRGDAINHSLRTIPECGTSRTTRNYGPTPSREPLGSSLTNSRGGYLPRGRR
jgi:hypothetical protein